MAEYLHLYVLEATHVLPYVPWMQKYFHMCILEATQTFHVFRWSKILFHASFLCNNTHFFLMKTTHALFLFLPKHQQNTYFFVCRVFACDVLHFNHSASPFCMLCMNTHTMCTTHVLLCRKSWSIVCFIRRSVKCIISYKANILQNKGKWFALYVLQGEAWSVWSVECFMFYRVKCEALYVLHDKKKCFASYVLQGEAWTIVCLTEALYVLHCMFYKAKRRFSCLYKMIALHVLPCKGAKKGL